MKDPKQMTTDELRRAIANHNWEYVVLADLNLPQDEYRQRAAELDRQGAALRGEMEKRKFQASGEARP